MSREVGEITVQKNGCVEWNIKNFREFWVNFQKEGGIMLSSPDFTYSGRKCYILFENYFNKTINLWFCCDFSFYPNYVYPLFCLRTESTVSAESVNKPLYRNFDDHVSIDFTKFLSIKTGTPLHDHLTVILRVLLLDGSVLIPDEFKKQELPVSEKASKIETSYQKKINSKSDFEPCEDTHENLREEKKSIRESKTENVSENANKHLDKNNISKNESKRENVSENANKHLDKNNISKNESKRENVSENANKHLDGNNISENETLKNLQKDFEKLFLSKEDTDVTLEVQHEEFSAHRAILRARSPVFYAMFSHDMSETRSGVVTINDCDPKFFPDFLMYLYTGKTHHISEKNVCHLYTVSDKYEVEELKRKCSEFMKSHISVETFCDFISLALIHGDKELIHAATDFFCRSAVEITKTVKWQKFLQENSTVGNELFRKALLKQNNIGVYNRFLRLALSFVFDN